MLRHAHADLEIPVPPPFETALFNFTIDFELAWGNGTLGGESHSPERRLEAALRQAENFTPFVELLRELQFPISWAVLGKLADHSADPEKESARFKPAWSRSDWYELPPLVRGHPSAWKGESYLRVIREQLPFCEVLSHGYAHIDYSDPATSTEIAREDLRLSRSVLEAAGLAPAGFVFPCNSPGHQELLHEQGFQVIRGTGAEWQVDRAAPFVRTPIGFWISPGVMSWREMRGLVRKGIRNKSFIHPWMHLIECDPACDDLARFYRPLFEMILEEQARGRLKNISYRELRSAFKNGNP